VDGKQLGSAAAEHESHLLSGRANRSGLFVPESDHRVDTQRPAGRHVRRRERHRREQHGDAAECHRIRQADVEQHSADQTRNPERGKGNDSRKPGMTLIALGVYVPPSTRPKPAMGLLRFNR
jgi:hypothetical protein